MWVYLGHLHVAELADLMPALLSPQIDGLVCRWARSVAVGVLFNQVDRLGAHGEALSHEGVPWSVILGKEEGTWPGPGFLWICGTR